MKPWDVNKKEEQKLWEEKKIDYMQMKRKINYEYQIGDRVRLLKQRNVNQVFEKGAKQKYWEKIYKINDFEEEGNRIKIIDENEKTKLVYPRQLKKIDNIIENPNITKEQQNIYKKEKTRIKKDKEKNRQNRKLNSIF